MKKTMIEPTDQRTDPYKVQPLTHPYTEKHVQFRWGGEMCRIECPPV